MTSDIGKIGHGASVIEENHVDQIASDFVAGIGTAVDLELRCCLMDGGHECFLNAVRELEFVANAIGFLAFVADEIDEKP